MWKKGKGKASGKHSPRLRGGEFKREDDEEERKGHEEEKRKKELTTRFYDLVLILFSFLPFWGDNFSTFVFYFLSSLFSSLSYNTF